MDRSRLRLAHLLGDTLLYGLPRTTQMALSILLVPVYTRYFQVSEYGAIENLNILGVLLTLVFGLALSDAMLRFYTVAESDEERQRLLSTAIVATTVAGIVVLIGTAAIAGWLGPRLLARDPRESRYLLVLLALTVLANLLLGVLQSALRARFRRTEYMMTALGGLVLSIVLTLVAVVGLRLGLLGVFLGPVIGYGVFVLYALHALRPELAVGAFSGHLLGRMLAYGIPFIPASLALFVMRSSDRYFITVLLEDPLTQVGLYSTAEKIMGPMALLTSAFATAWSAFAMAASRQPDARELYTRTFRSYVAVTSLIVIVLCAVSHLLLRIFTTPPYYPSAVYTPPLALYLALNGLYYIGSIGLMVSNSTRFLVPIVVGTALLNTALNVLLIPRWGVFGAAWATVAAFACFNAAVYLGAERRYRVGYPLVTALIVYVAAAVGAHLALLGAWIAALVVVAQIGVLWAVGFLEPIRSWTEIRSVLLPRRDTA